MTTGIACLFLLASLSLSSGASFWSKNKRESDRPCEDIANALVELTEIHESSPMVMPDYIDLYALIQHGTTVDMRDTQRVTQVVCDLVDLGTDAEAVTQYLESSGILRALVRGYYDYYVIAARESVIWVERDLAVEAISDDPWEQQARRMNQLRLAMFAALRACGFFDLDPAGVQVIKDSALPPESSGVYRRDATRGCPGVRSILDQMAEADTNMYTAIWDYGSVGFSSQAELFDFIEDITGANSVDDIYQAVNAEQIPTRLVTRLFQLAPYLREVREYLRNQQDNDVSMPEEYAEYMRRFTQVTLKLLDALDEAGYF